MAPVPVLTPAQAAAWDATAVARGRSVDVLMTSAGRAVAALAVDRFAAAASQGILVACGPGNNGGDGWVAARTLHAIDLPVWVVELDQPREDGPAGAARRVALADGVRVVGADGPWPGVGIIIDALLGTGATGAPRGAMKPLVDRLADLHWPVVAVDGPTGLDLNTGVQHGPLRAALTITFGGVRRGHLLARDDIGDLVVVDIGLPARDSAWPVLVDDRWCAERLPPLPARSHKGTRGHVSIVGGSPAMVGAARMAARSAFAAGAGLVHVIAPGPSLEILRQSEPDVQCVEQDFAGAINSATEAVLQRSDVVAVGPGLGREPGRDALVLGVLDRANVAVLDADGLTVLKPHRDALERLACSRLMVCTPHLGEFRTLFAEFADDLETDPWDAASSASRASGATVLLKGVPTVVASPDGSMLTVAAGNPGLATGGTGDVLTGIIAGLLAQGMAPAEAAALAAQAHGESADIGARRVTARGLRPMDVIQGLHDVWREWARPPLMRRVPVLRELPAPIET